MKVCNTTGTRCCVRNNADRISELPDELLVLILSRLTMNEAVRTGIISHRWEGLWKYFTGSYNFWETKIVLDGRNYVHWVNRLLRSHRGPTLDALRVCKRLDKSFEKIINSWIEFAVKKDIGILKLALGKDFDDDDRIFPSLHDLAFSNYRSLSTLYLSHINVTDQAVAHILSNCLLLEELCVRNSKSLVDVNIIGPNSLKLKHFEISKCLNLKSVMISSVNLVSFKFLGGKIALSFKNTPRLSQLNIGGDYCDFLLSDLGRLLLVQPSQLERLILDLSAMHPREAMLLFVKGGFPEFPNLKYLELGLKLEARDNYSILFLTSMIEACPCLQSFRLEATSFWLCRFESTPRRRYIADDMWTRVSLRKPCQEDIMSLDGVDPNFPIGSEHHQCFLYKHLEVVGLGGFSGHPAELELAMYLLEIAALRLEKLIIDPHHRDFPSKYMVPKRVKAARERAKQLEIKISSAAKTKLEIL